MRDVYQEVTDRIVSALEAGTAPWLRPWRDSKAGSVCEPYNAVSGRPYNGINLLVLSCSAFSDMGWLTFNQARELGGNVRKGERGTLIVFWKFEQKRDESSGEVRTVPFARGYTVFNVAQCENLDESKLKRPTPPVPGSGNVSELCARVGAVVRHGGNKAFYSLQGDFIGMPSADSFLSPDLYAGVLAHELTHWTGHESRCKREFGKRFGDMAYAFEELVAEIGSAFLCARVGVPLEGLNHPAYLESWLKVLKADKRAIFTAASKAREAAGFLLADRDQEDESIAA